MISARVPAALAAALFLSGCERPAGDASPGVDVPAPSATTSAKTISGSVPANVVDAVKCWGLVQGANVFHQAAPELAAGLPQASGQQKMAWFNEALRRASAAGMTVSGFKALQDEYQMSNRFATSSAVREAAVEPLRDCLARTPQDMSEPPQLAQG